MKVLVVWHLRITLFNLLHKHRCSFGPKKKEKWELSAREKVDEALKIKDAATGLFKVRVS